MRVSCACAFCAVAVSRARTASACLSAASKGRGIEGEERLTLHDLLSFGKVDRAQLARDLRPYLHARDRLHRADGREA